MTDIEKIQNNVETNKSENVVEIKNSDHHDDYDPHFHRKVEHPTTNFQSLVHVLKGCIGTGLLALPQAFHYAGYGSGLIGVAVLAFFTWYCWVILFRSKHILCKRLKIPILTYAQSMEKALEQGPVCLRRLSFLAIPIIDGMLTVNQIGCCCVYVVFVAAHIKQVFDNHIIVWHISIYIGLVVIPLILLLCIPSLKHLAPVSQLANIFAMVGIGIILYYVLRDGLTAVSTTAAFGEILDFPLFFCITLFAMNSIGIIGSVERNMETPKSFYIVISVAVGIMAFLYAMFGVLGYLRYGAECQGSIALNLPLAESAAEVAKVMYALAVFVTYALQAYLPLQILWKKFLQKKCENSGHKTNLLWQLMLRVVFVIFTCAFAILIPQIELFIGLVGALTLSLLGITFPALMAICVQYKRKYYGLVLLENFIIMIIGIMALVFGTYISLDKIIDTFKNGNGNVNVF